MYIFSLYVGVSILPLEMWIIVTNKIVSNKLYAAVVIGDVLTHSRQ